MHYSQSSEIIGIYPKLLKFTELFAMKLNEHVC